MAKQTEKALRNQKFMDFYKEISETEEFKALKSHKRVKYLAEEFGKRTKVDIPIGTIYKLIRNSSTPPVSSESDEATTKENPKENEVISTTPE